MSVLWLVVLTALFGAAQALLFAWFNYKQLSYNRYFAKNTAFRGEQTELIERIRNEKLLRGYAPCGAHPPSGGRKLRRGGAVLSAV